MTTQGKSKSAHKRRLIKDGAQVLTATALLRLKRDSMVQAQADILKTNDRTFRAAVRSHNPNCAPKGKLGLAPDTSIYYKRFGTK